MTLRSGIDTSTFDQSIRPQDDLFRYVNGTWIKEFVIPDDRASDGAFRELRDKSEIEVREIIEEISPTSSVSTEKDKIGALYQSFMDTERIEKAGGDPLAADLALIESATTKDQLIDVLGRLQRKGVSGWFGFEVDVDRENPEAYVVYIGQGGIGLPDESYYREDQYGEIRDKYVSHIAAMFSFLPSYPIPAADVSRKVFDLETRIAKHHWDIVTERDATKTNNPMSLDQFKALLPNFDVDQWMTSLGSPAGAFDSLNVQEPSFFSDMNTVWNEVDLDTWKTWLTWRTIRAFAPYLSENYVEQNFDFYGRTLAGTPRIRDRWKRGVSVVEGALGEAVGKIYVDRHFPPEFKEHMLNLVGNLIEAYRRSITSLDWMGEETKVQALKKLDSFTPKIGYPDKWRDYSSLAIDVQDIVGNVQRVAAFDLDYELNKIGGPIDKTEWFMYPQTVNAYYHPMRNEIVFPAAILRPPFFDPLAEDAVNYGGIGAVIGHEIGHGFDDQGSKYDGTGRLKDWWTEEDRSAFEKRTKELIAQYDAFVPEQFGDDKTNHVNGALTIGENIGDLGGLGIALDAYLISLGDQEPPVIDSMTGLERFFFGWAQAWREKSRDEALKLQIATDPHSPDEFRCNGVVRNLKEFVETFGVEPSDELYLEPDKRVTIWS